MIEMNTMLLAVLIFLLRVLDVSLGTVRTISLVNGRILTSVFLGFFEVLIWITVVTQVIAYVQQTPILLFAYAGGFACGNAVGILVEKKLAIGVQILQFFSAEHGKELATAIRETGQPVTVFTGEGKSGPVQMLTLTTERKKIAQYIQIIQKIEPNIFYTVESAAGIRRRIELPTPPTGWRAVTKKK